MIVRPALVVVAALVAPRSLAALAPALVAQRNLAQRAVALTGAAKAGPAVAPAHTVAVSMATTVRNVLLIGMPHAGLMTVAKAAPTVTTTVGMSAQLGPTSPRQIGPVSLTVRKVSRQFRVEEPVSVIGSSIRKTLTSLIPLRLTVSHRARSLPPQLATSVAAPTAKFGQLVRSILKAAQMA